MAQALFQACAPDLTVTSAGVAPWDHLHPMAVKLMHERGVSLEGHYPKHVQSMVNRKFDVVITIGDPARVGVRQDMFPDAQVQHWDISDPADADGTPDSEAAFRRAMAAIEDRMPGLLAQLK